MRKEELKKFELYCEKDDDGRVEQYYLRAECEIVDEYKKSKIIIDKIALPVYYPSISQALSMGAFPYATVNFGFGELHVLEPIREKILEEYPQKMTLKEIEKKLGYKVEVVSEK